MRYHVFNTYGIGRTYSIGRRSIHKSLEAALRRERQMTGFGWIVIDDDGNRWVWHDGPRKHGYNYCPACGRHNAYAEYDGDTYAPVRFYHADCWARLSDREQAAAWKHTTDPSLPPAQETRS